MVADASQLLVCLPSPHRSLAIRNWPAMSGAPTDALWARGSGSVPAVVAPTCANA